MLLFDFFALEFSIFASVRLVLTLSSLGDTFRLQIHSVIDVDDNISRYLGCYVKLNISRMSCVLVTD